MWYGEKSLKPQKRGAIWTRSTSGSGSGPEFRQVLTFLVKTDEHNQFSIINRFVHKQNTIPIARAKTKVLVQIAPGPNSPALP